MCYFNSQAIHFKEIDIRAYQKIKSAVSTKEKELSNFFSKQALQLAKESEKSWGVENLASSLDITILAGDETTPVRPHRVTRDGSRIILSNDDDEVVVVNDVDEELSQQSRRSISPEIDELSQQSRSGSISPEIPIACERQTELPLDSESGSDTSISGDESDDSSKSKRVASPRKKVILD